MITAQNRLAAANIASSNLKSGTDFSIAAIMARDELSRESSEYSISKKLSNHNAERLEQEQSKTSRIRLLNTATSTFATINFSYSSSSFQ